MTETNKKYVRIGYFALITIALVTVAVLLMVACVAIYRSGPAPFSKESVAAQFDRIAIPVYVCLGLVALGFVLHPLLPAPTETDKDRERMTAARLRDRTNLSLCPTDLASAICRERRRRLLHRMVTLALVLVGVTAVVWYASSFDRYSMEDLNGSMARSMLVFAPSVLLPGGYGLFSLFFNRASYRREIALYRQVPAEAKCDAPPAKKPLWETVFRHAVLVAAIGLIVVGWGMDGWMDVLTKAINICTECVGLG